MSLAERYEQHSYRLLESWVVQGHHAAEYACDLERILLRVWEHVKLEDTSDPDYEVRIKLLLQDTVDAIEESISMYEEEAEEDDDE